MRHFQRRAACAAVACLIASAAGAQDICTGYGPQAPRDIDVGAGSNASLFSYAPDAAQMNLCDIHLHLNAEHKAVDFSTYAGDGFHGGYQCNAAQSASAAELSAPGDGTGASYGVRPGDTVEVHWVYTSCDVAPGPTLGSCSSAACANPQLRVETQVFLALNDDTAMNFADFTLQPERVEGYYQPGALPEGTGVPVLYRGSTTGPKYDAQHCSNLQATWSVRPQCARLNIASLYTWFGSQNVFEQTHPDGVRPLVTAPALLSQID